MFTIKEPIRLFCTIGGTIAFGIMVGGDAAVAFVVGVFVGSLSFG